MSFILDALKKSETERQRSTVPSIADLPVVVQQPHTSAWVAVVIGALSIGIVVLGWAWWNASTPGESLSGANSQTLEAGPARPSRPVSQGPTRDLAAEARQAPRPAGPPQAQTQQPVPATEPPPAAVAEAAMTVGQLRAAGVAVPELTLELHVYSDEPTQRFVFINSRKYVEGEALQEGPRLLTITAEGAVLSQAGQNFLLLQE
jgi:general secretion pathway protein B